MYAVSLILNMDHQIYGEEKKCLWCVILDMVCYFNFLLLVTRDQHEWYPVGEKSLMFEAPPRPRKMFFLIKIKTRG